jgi:hypothetical protein
MEIINEGQAEKHRLQALVKLVAELGEVEQSGLYDLLQPREPGDAQDAQSSARATLLVAKECQLVSVDEKRVVRALVERAQFEQLSAFQALMGHRLLGVTGEDMSNYLFNLFSAWYAVQDEKVLQELVETGYDGPFNDQVFPDAPVRPFNSTKYVAWRKWAVFLGLGWMMRLGGRELLVPDATGRVRHILAELFEDQRALTCARFMEKLASICPELDGGRLFTYCWQASRGGEQKGNRLSLMLSTALRTLDGLGHLRLLSQADALENWRLYPAEGSRHQQVTHIEYRGR